MQEARRQDLIVIGASAGGVTALPRLASMLPRDLQAAVLVVQHLPETSPRHLVDIVQRESTLPVRWAGHGDALRYAEVVIAPPGTHLLVHGDHMMLSQGPRENHAKPSINRLFRSAAASRGNATIGVLLTGMLDDGVAGLDAITWCGGTAIVQDPADAEFPDLPRNAVRAVAVDRILPLAMIGPVLGALAGREVGDRRIPLELELHASLDRSARGDPQMLDKLGPRDTSREEAMWHAVRSLEEHAFTLSSRALDARARGDTSAAVRHDDQVEELQRQAHRQRELIVDLQKARGG